jgi:hypothetical protein
MTKLKFMVEVEVEESTITEKQIEQALSSFDSHLNDIGLWDDMPLTTHLTTVIEEPSSPITIQQVLDLIEKLREGNNKALSKIEAEGMNCENNIIYGQEEAISDTFDFIERELKNLPSPRITFGFREKMQDDEGNEVLAYPRANPMEYEYAIDFYWDSPEKAYEYLKDCHGEPDDWDEIKNWVLVRETQETLTPSIIEGFVKDLETEFNKK